jgi:hypothetical protein
MVIDKLLHCNRSPLLVFSSMPIHLRRRTSTGQFGDKPSLRRHKGMPRSIRARNIETRTSRLTLPVAGKPVFVKLGIGLSLGYRRNRAAGAWVLRIADGRGGNRLEALGTADDFEDSNGTTVLTFWEASRAARARGAAVGVSGKAPTPTLQLLTVSVALDGYQADLEARGGDVGMSPGRGVICRQHCSPSRSPI